MITDECHGDCENCDNYEMQQFYCDKYCDECQCEEHCPKRDEE